MSWTEALSDLRTLLSDHSTDKLRHRKSVFGTVDGTNKRFKTYEYRRVTNFVSDVEPLGVFVDGNLASIVCDIPVVGEFVLVTAPTSGQTVEASYYSQWFIDSELEVFLKDATNWIGTVTEYQGIPQGLRPAALKYAEGEAYQKLAMKYTEWYSQMYRLEDQQAKERDAIIKSYMDASEASFERARENRKSYYERQDQGLAPRSKSIAGAIPVVQPRR